MITLTQDAQTMDAATLENIARQLRQPHGEQGIQVGRKMNEGNLHINRFTIEALQVKPHDRILEIGMGNGFFVRDIVSTHDSVRYAGCDFSPLMVDEARILNRDLIRSGQAEFHLTTADNLPFQEESFHKLFTINTIYFWDDLTRALAEFRRVLKPAGTLIISLRPRSVMEKYPFVQYGFQLFSGDDVSTLLRENKFAVEQIIRRKEPDQEINGEKITVESLIVVGRRDIGV